MRSTKSNGFLTAAFVLSVGVAGNVFAQQYSSSEGIVRITDGRGRSNIRQTSLSAMQAGDSSTGQDAATGSQPTNAASSTGSVAAGYCPNGNCPTGGGCPCPYCQGGGGGHGCFREHYCKHSPDYGYSPPSKYPLLRRGVEYNFYYPAQWYGAGADYSQSQAPMVYQPTDTTQLGFYYQHVPFWRPQPNRVPERPIPAQWHIREPNVSPVCYGGGSGQCRTGYCRAGHGWGGHGWGGYGLNGSCPADCNSMPQQGNCPGAVVPSIGPTPIPGSQPVPAPVEPQSPAPLPSEPVTYGTGSVPTALPQLQSMPSSTTPVYTPSPQLPSTNSAASGHIRRLGDQAYYR